MKLERIYLDMDDVCNQFTMHALRIMGCSVNVYDDSIFAPEWKFDIIKAINALHPTTVWNINKFWGMLPEEAWSKAPKSYEYQYLLKWAAGCVGPNNVFFLSTPTLCPLSCSGKIKWIKRFAPDWMQRQYVFTPKKTCCANDTSLLIDDKDLNVISFMQADGHALLVPRPWNSAHGISEKGSRVTYLKHQLELIQKGCGTW